MYDPNFDNTFFLQEPKNVENAGKILLGVTAVALVCAAAVVGYFVYRDRNPKHRVIVNPVIAPEPPGWGPRHGGEEEAEV